jgi:ATP-dependent Clp protease ATP-binding subunit ClpX
MIPEFVGRLPVLATLRELDSEALVRILQEPRNALTKQYQKIFEFENVTLKFTDDALEMIAIQAIERKIGARGLRMIMEELMLEMMYLLPSQSDTQEVVITKDVVLNKSNPLRVMEKAG